MSIAQPYLLFLGMLLTLWLQKLLSVVFISGTTKKSALVNYTLLTEQTVSLGLWMARNRHKRRGENARDWYCKPGRRYPDSWQPTILAARERNGIWDCIGHAPALEWILTLADMQLRGLTKLHDVRHLMVLNVGNGKPHVKVNAYSLSGLLLLLIVQ